MKKNSKEKKNNVVPLSIPGHALRTASTCSTDKALFRALGLSSFINISTGKDYFVGEVKFENGALVKIWVCPMPALFWKIEVSCSETNQTTRLSTGSGALENFWQAIRLIADGMLVVDSVQDTVL